MKFNIWIALLVFLVSGAIDAVCIYDTLYTVQLRPIRGAITSMLIGLLGAITVISYIYQPIYLVPALLGHGIGCYTTLKWEKHKKEKKENENKAV